MKNYLIVFLVSMLPLIELRVAVPLGIGMGLQVLPVYIISIMGNMLPVPIIFFFARKILIWGKDKAFIGKFFTFCLEKGENAGIKLQEKAGRGMFFAIANTTDRYWFPACGIFRVCPQCTHWGYYFVYCAISHS